MLPTAEDATEVATAIAEYGNDLTLANGDKVKAIMDERQGETAKAFPYDNLEAMGRTALYYFDNSAASRALVKNSVVTDVRTGVRWSVQNISDEAFGGMLYCRTALVSAAPMTR